MKSLYSLRSLEASVYKSVPYSPKYRTAHSHGGKCTIMVSHFETDRGKASQIMYLVVTVGYLIDFRLVVLFIFQAFFSAEERTGPKTPSNYAAAHKHSSGLCISSGLGKGSISLETSPPAGTQHSPHSELPAHSGRWIHFTGHLISILIQKRIGTECIVYFTVPKLTTAIR